ncbi:MAG: hypothetical protein P8Y05_10695 [Deinococcales bacterium]
MKRTLRLGARVALTTAVLVGVALASAQGGTTQPATPPAASSQTPSMAQLQREALRLTLIAQLPAADRQQATQLLDRADALRQRALDLRRQELQAYIDALKSGSVPSVARAQAQQKVASERTSLAQDEATLRSDAQSFLQKVPQARALMRYLGGGRRTGLGLGGTQGQRGPAPYGPARPNGRRMGPGSGWTSPGANTPGMNAPGRTMRGWGLGDMPYGPMGPGMQQRRFYRDGMNRDGMNRDGMGLPWPSPWMPRRNAPGTPPTTAPQNSTPQNTTPPSGSGTGGA